MNVLLNEHVSDRRLSSRYLRLSCCIGLHYIYTVSVHNEVATECVLYVFYLLILQKQFSKALTNKNMKAVDHIGFYKQIE